VLTAPPQAGERCGLVGHPRGPRARRSRAIGSTGAGRPPRRGDEIGGGISGGGPQVKQNGSEDVRGDRRRGMAEGLLDLFHVRAAVAQIGRGEVAQIVQAHGGRPAAACRAYAGDRASPSHI
jgi:hypothetical protein